MHQLNLYRTEHAKYPHYLGDGSGRDFYIVGNNGGLTITKESHPLMPTGFRPPPSARGVCAPSPQKEATVFDYISDGSGRDFYITHNSGGLKTTYRRGFADFKASLRTYDNTTLTNLKHRRMQNPWTSDITDYMFWPSSRQRALNLKSAQRQRRLTDRLSPGRSAEKPSES